VSANGFAGGLISNHFRASSVNGGSAGTFASNIHGQKGISYPALLANLGTGGGGGAYIANQNTGGGGEGGDYGGGGGGGALADSGYASGKGGDGGSGVCVVIQRG
jgi:hypothetical protein